MNFAFRHEVRVFSAPASHPRLDRIEVLRALEDADKAWRRIESAGAIFSPYQSRAWVNLWHQHVASEDAEAPVVVVGYDEDNNPLFLWPLALRRMGPLSVATFIGGKHATLRMPPWRADYAQLLTASELQRILDHLAHEMPSLDLLLLRRQPAEWNGLRNPFALLPHQLATDDNYRLSLTAAPDAVAANISHGMRRRLRKKENHLAKLAGYRYFRASTQNEVERCLDAFFPQKAAHLAALGYENAFDRPGIQAFVRAACHDGLMDGDPLIELHALEGDGEILALFAGTHDDRRFTLAFNSLTRSAHTRHSPGLVLLQHIIADCARRGFEAFDIGPGDARYKTYFCKEHELVIDNVVPLSTLGRVSTPLIRAVFGVKGRIKRTPLLWNALMAVRRKLRGRRSQPEIHQADSH